jgi:membrane-bound lytic murein transglycosylase D
MAKRSAGTGTRHLGGGLLGLASLGLASLGLASFGSLAVCTGGRVTVDLGGHIDLVQCADRPLEILYGAAEPIPQLRQLGRAKHDQHDQEDQNQFTESHAKGHPVTVAQDWIGATDGFLASRNQVRYDRFLLMSTTRAARSGARGLSFATRGLAMLALSMQLPLASASATASAAGREGEQSTAKARAAAPSIGGEESLSERRAVRGTPVDEGPESPELNELRRFEEQAFPRTGSGFGANGAGDSDSPAESPPTLPGRWEGSGDVPEVLRSPDLGAEPVHVDPAPDSAWLRGLKLPELPVRWDPAVLRYLEYFRGNPRGRAIMAAWIRRAGRFRALIEATLEREGLPKDLLYIAMVESGFDTAARSRVGAGGVWQFMPGAARAYGLEVSYWVDARRDPERSAEAAARYLKDLFVRFGSWHLVFAAYNAGYGAVLKSITRYNTNDYWELCRHEAGLPWESSLYVPKILAAAIIGHNLEAFGFADVVPDPPFSYERVDVPAGTTLGTIARASQCTPETIAALNPQITRDRAPPDRGVSSLRIPVGARPTFMDSFERARGVGDNLETVTLRFGETLEAVARARGTTARELRRLNGVKDSAELRAGVAIVVPRRKGSAPDRGGPEAARGANRSTAGGGAEAGSADAVLAGVEPEDEVLVAVPDRVFNYEGRERIFYQTRDADTLEEVAEVFGIRIDDLVEWNNLDATAKLHPRMVLQIFVKKDFDPRDIVLLDPARVHVVTLGSQDFLELEAARRGKKRLIVEVRPGDTLARIGRRYGLTVGDLARINRFAYSTELKNGQKIVVYSPTGEPARELARGMAAEARRERGGAGVLHGATKPNAALRGGDRAPSRPPARSSTPEPRDGTRGVKAAAAGGPSRPPVLAHPRASEKHNYRRKDGASSTKVKSGERQAGTLHEKPSAGPRATSVRVVGGKAPSRRPQ